ncbi:peptidase M23 [Fictibacillus sp. KU28468]|uniref:peptidase M23 n=1 Tax=Fictibacillus sp. KU28468 TaxID=2991053 RepID=UPI00223CA7F8|nr:peptidase M23 [Fictibacillus sp. KU28468]UZJ79434.1 peptidase M23 [Fictibacillus sp. KU28468]
MIYEVLNKTNKQLAQIDELILMNVNTVLRLIDMQLQQLSEVEEQTEDVEVLRQLDQQVQQLKDNRIMFVLMTKYAMTNKLTVQEKNILLSKVKRV